MLVPATPSFDGTLPKVPGLSANVHLLHIDAERFQLSRWLFFLADRFARSYPDIHSPEVDTEDGWS